MAPDDSQVSRRELRQLKWLTTLVPGAVVLIYETARQEALEHILPALPVQYGNIVVWLLVVLLTYAFSALVFRIVERLQAQALARTRDLTTLNAIVQERARLSRELHDGFAQLVAYMLVRLDTVTGLVAANRGQEAMVELERMRAVTDDLYQDVRESISELRSNLRFVTNPHAGPNAHSIGLDTFTRHVYLPTLNILGAPVLREMVVQSLPEPDD
jgi:signal transduction histidine kinase